MDTNAEQLAPPTSDVPVERRQHPRRDCGLCIIAVPVDRQGNEIGPVVAGHCVNVSANGIRITLAAPIESELVRIEPVIDGEEPGFKASVFKIARHEAEYWCSTYAGPFVEPQPSDRSEQGATSPPLWPRGGPFAD